MTTGSENKIFELTLVKRLPEKSFAIESIDKILADDLVQLLSQFTMLIVTLQQRMNKESIVDDDIPF